MSRRATSTRKKKQTRDNLFITTTDSCDSVKKVFSIYRAYTFDRSCAINILDLSFGYKVCPFNDSGRRFIFERS